MKDTLGDSPIARLFNLVGARTRHALPFLAIAVVGSALALGGAPAWSVPIAALAAVCSALVSGADRYIGRDVVVRAWLVLVAVLIVQLLPLPSIVLRWIDPVSADVSARALVGFGIDRSHAWRALHSDPGSGLSDLLLLTGLGAVYVSSRTVSMRDGLERVLALCAASALTVAVIALAHLATGQERLYAVYLPRTAAPPILSPLLNPNHLAALCGAGAILWMGWAADATRADRKLLAGGAALACGLVCALSLSRGGVASAIGGLVLFVALSARGTGTPDQREPVRGARGRALVGAVVAALILIVGLWFAASKLTHEYVDGDASKFENFRRALGLLRGHALLGVGSGGVPVAVALSQRLDPDWTFSRVESLPIDLALGFGVPAALLALYTAGRALKKWLVPFDAPATSLAAWCAVVTVLVHDLADFSLFLGATAYFTAALAGALSGHHARRWRGPQPRLKRPLRWPALVALVGVAALSPIARRSPLEAERDRVVATLAASPRTWNSGAIQRAITRHPGDAYLQLLVGSFALAGRAPHGLRFVARAIELSPGWAQPHLVLAKFFSAHGRRAQALTEVGLALRRSARAVAPAALVVAGLAVAPTGDELDHMAPRGSQGLEFLDRVAIAWQRAARPDAIVAPADAQMLRRDPGFLPALRRRFGQAVKDNDLEAMTRLSRQALEHHPDRPEGYLFEARRAELAREPDAALAALERGTHRCRDKYPLFELRAVMFSRLGRTAEMRTAITHLIDTAGADLDRLVRAHGLHGALETHAGNLRGALEAYQLAHSLTAPEQPYLIQMAELYFSLHDRSAFATTCGQLLERQNPIPRARQLCERQGPNAQQGTVPDSTGAVDAATEVGR